MEKGELGEYLQNRAIDQEFGILWARSLNFILKQTCTSIGVSSAVRRVTPAFRRFNFPLP
ncbi:hypothetical protein HAX54_007107, partial [Datura stramonium]|nr:hypothetical protein [Datura stramonium]